MASPGDSALISVSARLLFANGQTTARTVAAVEQLADGLGFRAAVFPRWGELTVRIDDDTGSRYEIIAVEPVGVDMSKVAATMSVIAEVCDGRLDAEAARSALEAMLRIFSAINQRHSQTQAPAPARCLSRRLAARPR